MLIAGLLSTVLTRYGIQYSEKKNWLPKNHYQHKALNCLKNDDINGAISNNRITRSKDPDYTEAQIVHELILMWLDNRITEYEEAYRSDVERIDSLHRELNAIEKRKIIFSFIHAGLLSAGAMIPAFFFVSRYFLHLGLTGKIIIAGSIFLILAFAIFAYTKFLVFDSKKSPIIRLYEQQENLLRKVSIIEKQLKKNYDELSKFKDMRNQIKTEYDQTDT